MDLSTVLSYYNREDIQTAIVDSARNREVAVRYGDGGFGKRPDILNYPKDVIELAKQGATSFHVSEEIWRNPLAIDSSMKPRELEELRTGWDLVLDIDCPHLEFSGIAADLLVKALKYQGVNSISAKFSGNHGYHIGVPFKCFPSVVAGTETKTLFPEGPMRIALYLKEMIQQPLSEKILEYRGINEIVKLTGKKFNEVVKNNSFDPFTVLDIDTILIASRHLYRMPYSFNEKSGLVSLPINPSKILEFNKEQAKPESVAISKHVFLDSSKAERNEAKKILIQAFDFAHKEEDKVITKTKEYEVPETAIPSTCFPPCIYNILKGIKDGRKRSVFILKNFLSACGWGHDEIEKLIYGWNKKNPDPLKETIIKGQLSHHKKSNQKFPQPNCDNQMY